MFVSGVFIVIVCQCTSLSFIEFGVSRRPRKVEMGIHACLTGFIISVSGRVSHTVYVCCFWFGWLVSLSFCFVFNNYLLDYRDKHSSQMRLVITVSAAIFCTVVLSRSSGKIFYSFNNKSAMLHIMFQARSLGEKKL